MNVKLPFRYAGGKYYALKYLQPYWEKIDHDEYREPFLGGGSVFFAKTLVKNNWLNDIDSDLIDTLKFITDFTNRDKLLKLFESEMEATKKKYNIVKSIEPKNDLDRAYKYYYLNRTSFSGKMRNPSWGYRPIRSLPPHRWKERIIPVSKKLQNVKLTSVDFQEVIAAPKIGKNVLMFLDPPYYNAKQESHYKFPFTKYDHVRLCSLLQQTEYDFFLTYDDTHEIRKMYSWANIYPLKFFYRISNSKDDNDKRKIGNEIVISNYNLDPIQEEFDFSPKTIKKKSSSNKKIIKLKPVIEKLRSPIRFPGSKFQAIKYISSFWDCVNHDEYREPFLGGGSIFFAKPLVKNNWLNDIDSNLITTFKCIASKESRVELSSMVEKFIPSKETFNDLRDNYEPSNKLEIAYKYFAINRTAYSGIMNKPNWGYHPKKSVQPYKWRDRIYSAGEKLSHAKITNLHFRKIILRESNKSVFMFIDPPYFLADQKRAYFHSFKKEDHLELKELLLDTKYKFCLTYDDCNEIRELYNWANIHEFSWRYHTANSVVASRKMGKELIITNY
tara:strand:+ start:129 stop:1799 length:1671 start_codon:yes stop_codon:yes gene_type:complete